ncbi:MAG: DUF115 domain-containing protein [Spirochaetales bacterium]|nr:DUF115 domain-containing protein [Spirochaetales bacterium]
MALPPYLIKAVKEDSYTVFYRNTLLYDKANPQGKIAQKIRQQEIKPDTLIIIPSPLLFYGIEELYACLPESCRLLCIESDISLYNLKDNAESRYSCDFEYLKIEDPDFFLNYIDNMKHGMIKNVLFLPLNRGYYLNRDFYQKCYENIKKSLKNFLKNSLTLYSLGHRYFTNIFLNMPEFCEKNDIRNLVVDSPVFIAGAGESLESSLPLIKKYRRFFKILALDTAIKTLAGYGITPDFIVAVESQLYNIFDFIGFRYSKIPLIADITSYPLTSRIFKGKKYYFTSHFTNSEFLEKCRNLNLIPSFIPPLGSVGITALYIALQITDKPVFYSGLDFSFTPGKTHSKDSPSIIDCLINMGRLSGDKNYALSFSRDLIPVKNIKGEDVYTTSVLKSYSETMSDLIAGGKSVYSLFSCGITGNANNIADEEEFKKLIPADTDKCGNPENILSGEEGLPVKRAEIKTLLESELVKTDAVIKAGVDALNGQIKNDNLYLIKKLTKDSDYLLPKLPGINYSKDYTDVTVKYILLSCYRFRKIISNTLEVIHHQS